MVSHDDSAASPVQGGGSILRHGRVLPALAGLVARVELISGSFDRPVTLVRLPDATTNLVFTRSGGFTSDDAQLSRVPVVLGPLNQGRAATLVGQVAAVNVVLTPLAAESLLQAPASRLVDQVEPLAALLASARVARMTSEAETLDEWSLRIQGLLAEQRRDPSPTTALVSASIAEIQRRNGAVRIGALSSALSVSISTLERAVARATGFTPKRLADIIRFQHAIALLRQEPAPGAVAVASAAGYSDEAHMIRSFRQFADLTPRSFVREQVNAPMVAQ